MSGFKFQDAPFEVQSPDVTYTDKEIVSNYTYETVVVENGKVRLMNVYS
jgi:hypothetical protein